VRIHADAKHAPTYDLSGVRGRRIKVSSASMDLPAPHAADIIYVRKRTTEVVEITHSDS
jgi:hypothetical protein